ncbi:YutD family protein [Streptococcus ovis]|uniref:YutD family protein n=1 Tax=Streptococcus ovis TaxID=82806 RepID=UPI0003763F7E|nr:YutD-like domain-containing protein [Streptococcus ovis]
MKKEVSPELYNYNKFPGPAFARVGDKVVSEGIELDLLVNHKEAFDQTVFGQRFSQLMLKFDYIVGDWGNEQLRLKGFYKDDKPVASHLKIGRLDDYLLEYCNFGCAYFVLGNENPQEMPAEPEEKPRRRRNRSRNNRKPQQQERTNNTKQGKSHKAAPSNQKQQKQERQKRQDKKKTTREIQEAKRGFVIRQKER